MLVDVGARGGISRKWWPLKTALKAIGFEPDDSECRQLNKSGNNELYLPIALSNTKGTVKLNLTRHPSCVSVLKPNYALLNRFLSAGDFEITTLVDVPSDTLGGAIIAAKIKNIDFIKVDTQGSELEILRGAEQIISNGGVFGIEVEIEFSQLYEGQALFGEVDGFLRRKGFALFDIEFPLGRKVRKTVPINSKGWKGQGLWSDALYFRDYVAADNTKVTRNKAMKAIAIAELHGFGDYALELLDLWANDDIIMSDERKAMEAMLLTHQVGRFAPECQLLLNSKNAIGEFLLARCPSLYELLAKLIRRR